MYVGNRYTVSVSGTRWKPLKCAHCGLDWAYKVSRKATGEGRSPYFLDNQGAQNRARESAIRNLERSLETAFDNIACPKCGWYQPDMVRRLQSKQNNGLLALGILAIIGSTMVLTIGTSASLVGGVVGALVTLALGILFLVVRSKKNAAYDPNVDAQNRARRDLANEPNVITREKYDEIMAQAAEQGVADQLQRIEWAKAA